MEIIVSIGIASFIVLGGEAILMRSLQSSSDMQERATVQGLFQEAAVAIDAIARDSWNVLITGTTLHPAVHGGSWQLDAGSEDIPLNGIVFHRSAMLETAHRATRNSQGGASGEIVSTGGYEDPDTIIVHIKINWSSPRDGDKTVTNDMIVTNWRGLKIPGRRNNSNDTFYGRQ